MRPSYSGNTSASQADATGSIPVGRSTLILALLVFTGSVSSGFAQTPIHKCTDAEGRTSFSDKPCVTVRPPSAESINALCSHPEAAKLSDAAIQSLAEAQRQAVAGLLRGLVAGSRDGANLQRTTLRIDASRNAILCLQRQGTNTYVAFQVEPNGRTVTLQPGEAPLVANDANEPTTMAARCASLVTSCLRPKTAGRSIDDCFEQAPVCAVGRLDAAASCCPQACKDAYRRERAAGTDAETATIKVMFGDESGAASCVPGMPSRR